MTNLTQADCWRYVLDGGVIQSGSLLYKLQDEFLVFKHVASKSWQKTCQAFDATWISWEKRVDFDEDCQEGP